MKFLKRTWPFFVGLFIVAGLFAASNDFTDRWTVKGTGTLNNTAIGFIDSAYDFNLYSGDVRLGQSLSRPSTTADTYPGLLVPIYNGSGSAMTEGDVIIASGTAVTAATQSGYGSMAAVLATTTVLGVASESIANGAVGLMRVAGYALVKTTGTVMPGDILVTTGTVAGYAGKTTGTQVVGTAIGKAVMAGTVTGGSTLVLLTGK